MKENAESGQELELGVFWLWSLSYFHYIVAQKVIHFKIILNNSTKNSYRKKSHKKYVTEKKQKPWKIKICISYLCESTISQVHQVFWGRDTTIFCKVNVSLSSWEPVCYVPTLKGYKRY